MTKRKPPYGLAFIPLAESYFFSHRHGYSLTGWNPKGMISMGNDPGSETIRRATFVPYMFGRLHFEGRFPEA